MEDVLNPNLNNKELQKLHDEFDRLFGKKEKSDPTVFQDYYLGSLLSEEIREKENKRVLKIFKKLGN